MTARELLEGCRGLVFDLDGTLADTGEDLWRALNAALQDVGRPGVPLDVVLESLHGGLPATAAAALRGARVSDRLARDVLEAYRLHYGRRDHAATRLYPGAAAFLASRAAAGTRLAVCTNKAKADAMALLERLGIARCFDVVVGYDSTRRPKPDPEGLQGILRRWGLGRAQAAFIGDSVVDAQCAAAAQVPFVLHAAGYGARDVEARAVQARFQAYAELASPPLHPGVPVQR